MRGDGRLTRKQLKGLLVGHVTSEHVPDSDITALLRRADADDDGELSFSDFFSTLLPYFIFGSSANKA